MYEFSVERIREKTDSKNESFLQGRFWCDFKARHGWTVFDFRVCTAYPEPEDGDCGKSSSQRPRRALENFEVSVLVRSFMKGLFSICYVPLARLLPFVCTSAEKVDEALSASVPGEISVIEEDIVVAETQTIETAHFMRDLALALKKHLPVNAVAIRFDPDIGFQTVSDRETFNFGMQIVSFADGLHVVKCRNDIQPPDTVVVSLVETEDEILSRMHSKWRYNIRLAERKGVKVSRYLGSDEKIAEKIDTFYELTKETNLRDGNSSHSKDYYLDLMKHSAMENRDGKGGAEVSLYIADFEGDQIAAVITLFSGNEAVYLYGASSGRHRNLMPNHLLQWTAMMDAKKYGCRKYDLYGIPPEGKDGSHPMHGLYMFKANFGGLFLHRTGSWDVPYRFSYRFYRTAENLRAFWHKKVVKRLHGR